MINSAQPTREQRIHHALSDTFKPEKLTIENESQRHRFSDNTETHFKILLVSTQFENINRVARHRQVNQLLATEFQTGLHALSLHLYTPSEWLKQSNGVRPSPTCKNKLPSKKSIE